MYYANKTAGHILDPSFYVLNILCCYPSWMEMLFLGPHGGDLVSFGCIWQGSQGKVTEFRIGQKSQ